MNITCAQFQIPEKPELQTSVYDYIGLLKGSQETDLRDKLIRYSDSTSTQIVVAIIESTEGENILYLGAQWAHQWGIGQEKEDNGILILLAHGDRKIAINTGYGVEHLLTDAMSRRIIERDIIPYFKRNDYYGGLENGVDTIFMVLQGEYQAKQTKTENDFPIGLVIILIIILIVFIIAISKGRKGGDSGRRYRKHDDTTRDIIEAIILSRAGKGSYRRSSGGFGGFGKPGGGFGSGGFSGGFGGGGFGGGGASGSW